MLGLVFARKPFAFVDRLGARTSGVAMPLAVIFTRSGYTPALASFAVAATLIEMTVRRDLVLPVMLIACQLLGQVSSNGAKRFVARLRPEVWHFREELGFAYPSGHAVSAVVFYVGWAAIFSRWPVSDAIRDVVLIAAIVWALGIGWSRLSLGAHRVTDIIGGYALGSTWLCIMLAAAHAGLR